MEEWKTISISYYYRSSKIAAHWEVSNEGRIKKNGNIITPVQFNLNPKYLICSKGLIHRLVAKAFIPNPENKPEVDHIDGNTKNNNVTNLRWVTSSENKNNPITKKKWLESMHRYFNSENYIAPMKGRHLSEESKKKLHDARINKPRTTPIWNKGLKNCYSKETIEKRVASTRATKAKWTEEYKKELYSNISERQKGNTAVKGYVHINNGVINKMVSKNILQNYLLNGWKCGRILKRKN